MPLECDVALLGTGLAPLLAAQSLLRQGHSVLLLNPDHDFFRENSELPLEPVFLGDVEPRTVEVIRRQHLDRARDILAPEFPGSIEVWSRESAGLSRSFRDPSAPFLRARQWNWIPRSHDDAYLRLLEEGLNPLNSNGLAAARRFPGYNWQRGLDPSFHALGLDRLVDADLDRYRNGVLEFVQSRISSERMLTSISGLEVLESGLRFLHRGSAVQVRASKGLWIFWTPRVTSWLEKFCASRKQEKLLPSASTIAWEEWSLRSRDPVDPSQVGITEDAVAWARIEGEPREPWLELNVLMPSASGQVAGAESFLRLSRFVQSFLNWDRFRIRDLRTRTLLGVPPGEWFVESAPIPVRVMSGCEGGLVGVVDRAMRFASVGVA
jgi:hypothetical protein